MAVLLGEEPLRRSSFIISRLGAADDLAKATEIARSMVMRYGRDKQLGHVAYTQQRQTMLGMPTAPGLQEETYSEETERTLTTLCTI